MLGIQLEALSVAEIRRLLDRARARGQESLARQLEAELAARPGRAPVRPMMVPAPPEPAPRRMTIPPARQPAPVRRRRRGPAVAVAGIAAFVGATLAWGISVTPPQPARQPALLTAGVDESAPRIAVALTTTALPEEAPEQPAEEPAAPALTAVLPREPARAPTTSANPCLDLPTARERLVCGYPSLAILDRRMNAALARARSSGADLKAIDDAQTDWQQDSANISDRMVLNARYAQRIAELEAQ